jgi:hypothetical protein
MRLPLCQPRLGCLRGWVVGIVVDMQLGVVIVFVRCIFVQTETKCTYHYILLFVWLWEGQVV